MLEDLITSFNLRGWTIGTLCQDSGAWYACMVDELGFAHCANGATACEAITNAVNAPKQSWLTNRYIYERPALSDTEVDLFALGLVKRREPLKRRF